VTADDVEEEAADDVEAALDVEEEVEEVMLDETNDGAGPGTIPETSVYL
jgi:hypothetical protein